jgi:hypothetical protein
MNFATATIRTDMTGRTFLFHEMLHVVKALKRAILSEGFSSLKWSLKIADFIDVSCGRTAFRRSLLSASSRLLVMVQVYCLWGQWVTHKRRSMSVRPQVTASLKAVVFRLAAERIWNPEIKFPGNFECALPVPNSVQTAHKQWERRERQRVRRSQRSVVDGTVSIVMSFQLEPPSYPITGVFS